MKVSHYNAGLPCWVELASHAPQEGKKFYSELFNWGTHDIPIPEGTYTMLRHGDADGPEIGATYQMDEKMIEAKVPTNWTVYFAVDDVDKTIEAVLGAGGSLVIGPHSIGTAGKMAVFNDLDGAVFAVWQAGDHIGSGVKSETNALCWVELMCKSSGDSKAFYSKALGWEGKRGDMQEFEYTMWQSQGEEFGGMMEMTAEWGDTPPHWMLYFQVDDCDSSASKAKALGGNVCVPPTDIPNIGRFAVINDPQGGVFSIITLTAN